MSQLVRGGDLLNIERLTTPNGFRQITRDIVVSKNDPRLKMLMLRAEDIRRTIPVKVYFIQSDSEYIQHWTIIANRLRIDKILYVFN